MFTVGDKVICDYRLPSVTQPWVGLPLLVGTIVEASDDPALWNGRNSERHYCEVTGKVPVHYRRAGQIGVGFTMQDSVESLRRVPAGFEDWREHLQVLWALGFEALWALVSSRIGIRDQWNPEPAVLVVCHYPERTEAVVGCWPRDDAGRAAAVEHKQRVVADTVAIAVVQLAEREAVAA